MLGAKVGEEAHHRLAVLQHIGDARGRAAVVLQNEELIGRGPHDIDTGDVAVDALGRFQVLHLWAEPLVMQDQPLGDMTRALHAEAVAAGANLCDRLRVWFVDHAVGYEAQIKTILQSA